MAEGGDGHGFGGHKGAPHTTGIKMALHKGDWPKQTWSHPLPHDFTFSFGLGIDNLSDQNSTFIPYVMQDNAIIDYETIKTNKENDDFAVVAKPNCAAGSYVPKCTVAWKAFSPVEIKLMQFHTMKIHTAMLSRLDAFDKKTGNDIETILELTHETTDEQAYGLHTNVKLFEGHLVQDLPAEIPGLDTNQQPEAINFDMELYFDALHYYTNREMLRSVTDRMKTHTLKSYVVSINSPIRDIIVTDYDSRMPSVCKYMNPYTLYGEIFHAPKTGSKNQVQLGSAVTDLEHLTILGRVRFNEYNPDFNFSRA